MFYESTLIVYADKYWLKLFHTKSAVTRSFIHVTRGFVRNEFAYEMLSYPWTFPHTTVRSSVIRNKNMQTEEQVARNTTTYEQERE